MWATSFTEEVGLHFGLFFSQKHPVTLLSVVGWKGHSENLKPFQFLETFYVNINKKTFYVNISEALT
jgi:hypothetical protein